MDQYLKVRIRKDRIERRDASLITEYPAELKDFVGRGCLPKIESEITYDVAYWHDFEPLNDFMIKYNSDYNWSSTLNGEKVWLGRESSLTRLAEIFEKILEDHSLADKLFPTNKYADIDLFEPIYDDEYFTEIKKLATLFRKLASVYNKLSYNAECDIYYIAED